MQGIYRRVTVDAVIGKRVTNYMLEACEEKYPLRRRAREDGERRGTDMEAFD